MMWVHMLVHACQGSGVAAGLLYDIPNIKYVAMSQAPSSAARYENYSKLQKDRVDAPFLLSGRPAGAKVRVLTLSLPSGLSSIKTHCTCGSSFDVLHVCTLLSCTKLLAVSSLEGICVTAAPPTPAGPQSIWGV